jgi:8-oxo-dGTP diphosphatase
MVLGEGARPRIAIVRLRRDKSWVLPKGKLNPGEHALAGAKREVLEETGHEVSVHGFLGTMLYSVDGRIKIVQFWHMRAIGAPMREPMDDIKSVIMAVVETSPRDPHARSRKGIPRECGSGRAQGSQAIHARQVQQAVCLQ